MHDSRGTSSLRTATNLTGRVDRCHFHPSTRMICCVTCSPRTVHLCPLFFYHHQLLLCCLFVQISSDSLRACCQLSSCGLQGLDVVYLHLHIQVEPGVPSSGGSSFRALWVVSPRSRHRPLLLDLRRLSLPTPHILQCVVLESQMLSALVSPRVPPWMETLVVHCSSAGSIYPSGGCCVLGPPILPHAYPYALTTVYLAVPDTLPCRVFQWW